MKTKKLSSKTKFKNLSLIDPKTQDKSNLLIPNESHIPLKQKSELQIKSLGQGINQRDTYTVFSGVEPKELWSYTENISSTETSLSLMISSLIPRELEISDHILVLEEIMPEKEHEVVKEVLKKVVLDKEHPMYIQYLFSSESLALDTAKAFKDLSECLNDLNNSGIQLGSLDKESFNKLIRNMSLSEAGLLGTDSIDMNICLLRALQGDFFKQIKDIDDSFIEEHLSFGAETQEDSQKVHINRANEDIAGPANVDGRVVLNIPECNNRQVNVSAECWNTIKIIHEQLDEANEDCMNHLRALLPKDKFKITGRVKSPEGILDKMGRIAAQNEKKPNPKYKSMQDIIDISGIRVTCAVDDMSELIDTLKKSKFKILEFDNKYKDIRKNGAYKILACCIHDPDSKTVFELQIVSPLQVSVSDLEHNICFKAEKIGLRPTDKEKETTLGLQRTAALMETLRLKTATEGKTIDAKAIMSEMRDNSTSNNN